MQLSPASLAITQIYSRGTPSLAPLNTSAPVVSVVGSTLSTTNGTWSNTPTGYTYQWYAGGVLISGATSSSYTATVTATYTCVVTATNGYGSTPATSNGVYVNPATGDVFFMYNTLLLKADGTNGAQNNTFLVTPPGGVGSYAGSFNGSSQYLTAAANANLALGSGDFTVEFWAYLTANPSGAMIASVRLNNGGASGTWGIYSNRSGKWTFAEILQTPTTSVASNTAPVLNTWTHVAIVRSGTTLSIYLNGVSDATGTSSTNFNNSSYPLRLMNDADTIYTGGYLSNFRIVKGTAVYTSNFTPPTSPLTAITNTQLLTCQSATFVDNSANAFTITNNGTATIVDPNTFPAITRNGTPTQGSFSPYGTLWSNYFNGSTDYLSIASQSAFGFGTGDFTIEYWIYPTTIAGSPTVVDLRSSTSLSDKGLSDYYSSGKPTIYYNPVGDIAQSSIAVTANTWNHVAFSRSSGTLKIFVNGQQGYSAANSTDFGTTQPAKLAANYASTAFFTGYISNARIVKGTAVYTSAFTPSTTPLTAITNTSLLTCQSSRFRDASSNAFAITANGTPSVQRFSPFEPSAAYSPATTGGSAYFNGSTDSLSVSNNAALSLSTGDFTIESWIYLTGTNKYSVVSSATTSARGYSFEVSSTLLGFNINNGGTNTGSVSYSGAISTNTWHHVAASRSGTTTRLFVDGVQVTSGTLADQDASTTNAIYVGAQNYTGFPQYFSGYIADARIVKGTALYTAAFTPPTAPITPVANTSLLTNFTNAGITDSAAGNDLVTVGDAQVSTAVVKYGTGSIKFDGTGDYVSAPISNNFVFGSGDFTIEGWFYKSAQVGSVDTVVTYGWTSTTSAPFVILYNGSNQLQFYASSAGVSWDIANAVSMGTFTTGQWNHFAVSRQGSSIRLFMNGVLQNTATSSASLYVQTTYPLTIGGNGNGGNLMNGYIDDLRITKGYARYTANFTPPTAALPDF